MKKVNFFVIFLLILVFWIFFLPGPRVATDYPYWFPEELSQNFREPLLWRDSLGADGMGQSVISTAWTWPIIYIYGFFANLGLDFTVLSRFLGIIPFLLIGTFSISKLLTSLKVEGWPKVVGSLFFLANTYVLLLIDGGQVFLALAYSILPLAFVYHRESIEAGTWKSRIKFGLITLVLSIFDIRVVYLLLFLVGTDFISNLLFTSTIRAKLEKIKNYFVTGLIAILILVGFHSYWLLPAVFTKSFALPLGYDAVGQVDFLSFSTLGHSLYLLQPHWFKNAFGSIADLNTEFVLIPVLVFLAPILLRRNDKVLFWVAIALVSVFLTKGTNAPFGQVYTWLFNNIPGFSLFRDPTKFFYLVALSYSVLLAFSVDAIARKLSGLPKLRVAFLLFVTCYLLLLVRPVWLGQMTGLFSNPPYQELYQGLTTFLKSDKEFGRVLWMPTVVPLGYSSSTHPQALAYLLAQKRPFAVGNVGTYETLNFIREAPFMDQIFDIAGIRYIAYPYPDVRKRDLKPEEALYYNVFLEQMSSLPWATLLDKNPAFGLLKTKSSQDRFFIAQNTWFVVGSDDIYKDLIDIPGFRLANNAFVFTEEQPGLLSRLEEFPGSKILLNQKSGLDIIAGFIDPAMFVFPSDQLEVSPNEFGWWKRDGSDLLAWRDFLQQKYGIDNLDFDYGGGWAVGEGNVKLQITNDKLQKGDMLLARVMKSSRGGTLKFYQGNSLLGEIGTKIDQPEKTMIKLTGYGKQPDLISEYDKADFFWFGLQPLVEDRMLTIETEGDINVVNAVSVLSQSEWDELKNKADELAIQGRMIDLENLSNDAKSDLFVNRNDNTSVSYERMSPAKYKVKISGLKTPATLVFSETYDHLWGLKSEESDKPPVELYSFINGFNADKDGEYEVYFKPQKYVWYGLLISGGTILLIGIFVIISCYRKKS